MHGSVLLPQPLVSTRPKISPQPNLETDALQRGGIALEALRDPLPFAWLRSYDCDMKSAL
jgi:hypothetical protein